mmetsp:Transcript_84575/g.192776  ORF Transcript_84575/g.192776 Transcript_84575/m.192776 type:complete len:245 (+) Transcript_84575:138-872(+)
MGRRSAPRGTGGSGASNPYQKRRRAATPYTCSSPLRDFPRGFFPKCFQKCSIFSACAPSNPSRTRVRSRGTHSPYSALRSCQSTGIRVCARWYGLSSDTAERWPAGSTRVKSLWVALLQMAEKFSAVAASRSLHRGLPNSPQAMNGGGLSMGPVTSLPPTVQALDISTTHPVLPAARAALTGAATSGSQPSTAQVATSTGSRNWPADSGRRFTGFHRRSSCTSSSSTHSSSDRRTVCRYLMYTE